MTQDLTFSPKIKFLFLELESKLNLEFARGIICQMIKETSARQFSKREYTFTPKNSPHSIICRVSKSNTMIFDYSAFQITDQIIINKLIMQYIMAFEGVGSFDTKRDQLTIFKKYVTVN